MASLAEVFRLLTPLLTWLSFARKAAMRSRLEVMMKVMGEPKRDA